MSGDPLGKLVCVCGVCVGGVHVCVCVCVGGGGGEYCNKPTVYSVESGCVLTDCNCLVSTLFGASLAIIGLGIPTAIT